MKKRLLSLLLVLVMLLGIFAGCSSNDAPEVTDAPKENDAPVVEGSDKPAEKTKITFMGWGTDAEVATFTAMIEQYETAYPDVDVEYIVVAEDGEPQSYDEAMMSTDKEEWEREMQDEMKSLHENDTY